MIYVIIWIACGFIAGAIAQGKGQSVGGALLIGFLLGPLGLLLVAVMRPNIDAIEQSQIASGAVRKCPHCAELIRPEATICRYCQQPVEAVVMPSAVARIVSNGKGGFLCSACGGGTRADATECKHCRTPLFTPAATYIGLKEK